MSPLCSEPFRGSPGACSHYPRLAKCPTKVRALALILTSQAPPQSSPGTWGLLSRMKPFPPVALWSFPPCHCPLRLTGNVTSSEKLSLTALSSSSFFLPLATPSRAFPRALYGGYQASAYVQRHRKCLLSPRQVAWRTAGTYEVSGNQMNRASCFSHGNIGTLPGATSAPSPGRKQ